ncbi:MAG: ester cyclase [Pseudomonadota bacterium]
MTFATTDAAPVSGAVRPNTGLAHDRTPSEVRNVETVLRLFDEGWGANEGWRDVWRRTMTADFRSIFHSEQPVVGIENAIEFNAALFGGFPKLVVSVEDVITEGDRVIVRGRLTGTQDGPFLGVPPSGNAVDVPDVTMFTLADGKVTEMRYFTDLLVIMTAIGAVPE